MDKYKCIECGEIFYRNSRRRHKGRMINYCSKKCQYRSPIWRDHISGKNNHNYKGHKTTTRGYKMIRSNDRYSNGHFKYVFEHRLIMETILKRKLKPLESVHHLNGIRTDNRPENLKIMFKNLHDAEGHTYIKILQNRIRHLESLLNN